MARRNILFFSLEIFYEFCSYLPVPDLIKLVQVCKQWGLALMGSPTTWSQARKRTKGLPILDPPPGMPEWKYAMILFSEHRCSSCRKTIHHLPHSVIHRLYFCYKTKCLPRYCITHFGRAKSEVEIKCSQQLVPVDKAIIEEHNPPLAGRDHFVWKELKGLTKTLQDAKTRGELVIWSTEFAKWRVVYGGKMTEVFTRNKNSVAKWIKSTSIRELLAMPRTSTILWDYAKGLNARVADDLHSPLGDIIKAEIRYFNQEAKQLRDLVTVSEGQEIPNLQCVRCLELPKPSERQKRAMTLTSIQDHCRHVHHIQLITTVDVSRTNQKA